MDITSLQHVNLKIAAADAAGFDLTRVIPVFHRWIQDGVLTDELTLSLIHI